MYSNNKILFALAIGAGLLVSCSEETGFEGNTEKESLPVVPPTVSDDVLFACDFQESADMDMFVNYDLDMLKPSAVMSSLGFEVGTAWIGTFRDSYTSENYFAGSTSSYTPAGQANDWLVLKEGIEIPSKGYVLSWKSQALDLEKRDGLNIYISTEGNVAPDNFNSEPVFVIEEEEAGATTNTDNEWTEHFISLDEYVGKKIWFAFVNQSDDKNVLCLDDIEIKKQEFFTLECISAEFTVDGNLEVKGRITAKEKEITSFNAYYQAENGTSFGEAFENLSIGVGESYEFAISKKMKLEGEAGTFERYQFWAENSTSVVALNDSAALVPFEPIHKVVIEEGTGQWCGYCPLGILAFDYLLPKYKDQLIAIAVHNKDAMTVAEYDRGLAFNAFPTGIVNRTISCTPTTSDYQFEGAGSFHEGLMKELQIFPEAEVRLADVNISSDSIVSFKSNTRFALKPTSEDYRLAYVVISNNYYASGAQANYLASTDRYETFGKFGKGGEYGQSSVVNMPYNEVACGIFPSFKGAEGIIPSQPTLGETYSHDFEIDLKECLNINEEVSLELIVMLINGEDGSIINADKVELN